MKCPVVSEPLQAPGGDSLSSPASCSLSGKFLLLYRFPVTLVQEVWGKGFILCNLSPSGDTYDQAGVGSLGLIKSCDGTCSSFCCSLGAWLVPLLLQPLPESLERLLRWRVQVLGGAKA